MRKFCSQYITLNPVHFRLLTSYVCSVLLTELLDYLNNVSYFVEVRLLVMMS